MKLPQKKKGCVMGETSNRVSATSYFLDVHSLVFEVVLVVFHDTLFQNDGVVNYLSQRNGIVRRSY